MDGRAVDSKTADGGMNTYVFYSARAGPFPVVIFYRSSAGVLEELSDIGRRIATVGY